MQPTASFKLTLLRHTLVGLRGVSSSGSMTILERKAAIKHAADMAMAAARGSGARWSRALILANLSKDKAPLAARGGTALGLPHLARSSKKILRRSFRACSRAGKRKRPRPPPGRVASATLLARTMVKKRAQVLRRLVPGGEALDGFSLLEETLDYVVSLRAQVELMRRLTEALGLAHPCGSTAECHPQEKKDS